MQRFTSSLKVLYMETNHRERWLLPEISWHDFTAAILQSSSEKLCVGGVFFFLPCFFSHFFLHSCRCLYDWASWLCFFIAQAVSLVDNVVCRVFIALHTHSVMPMFSPPPRFFLPPPTGCFFFCVLLALLFMAYLVYWQNAKRQLNKTAEKLPLHQQRALLRRTAEWSLKHVNTRHIRQQINTLYLSACKKMFKDQHQQRRNGFGNCFV